MKFIILSTKLQDTMSLFLYVVCALLLLTPIRAFYLPGLAPVNYCKAGEDNGKTCKVSTRNH